MAGISIKSFNPKKILHFVEHDIWRIKLDPKKEKIKYFLLSMLKVMVYSFHGFKNDNVAIRASALTFFSLLSIVPLLAMAFGIAKGFALEKQFQEELMNSFSGQAEVIDQSLEFAQNLIENTEGGLIAGIGFAVLVYSVVSLFSNIEQSFNSIWHVKKERTLVRKLTDYLAIVLLAPVFLIGASGLTYKITSTIESLTSQVSLLGFFDRFVLPSLQLLPYTIIWIFFTLMYMIMPNTKVNFKAAFIASIIAGTAYQVTQWALINFQIGVAKYNAIYGSFAALPLFLFWLQISWLIFLFGAEIAFSIQNVNDYENESFEKDLSHTAKLEASFVIVRLLVKRFANNEKALNVHEISDQLKLPVNVTDILLEDLKRAGVLTRTEDVNGDASEYQPALDISKISIAFVMDRLNEKGKLSVWENDDFEYDFIRKKMLDVRDEVKTSEGSLLFKDMP